MGNGESVNSDSRDDDLYQSSGYGAPSGAYFPDTLPVHERNPVGTNSGGYYQYPPPVNDRKPREVNYERQPSKETNYESQTSTCSLSLLRQNKQKNPRSSFIADNFSSLDAVIDSLREAGLESSNLILGIDFTKSNEWTGKRSFHRKSLHAIGSQPNPYKQAISIIGRTLSPFDEDNSIPCFGFGDDLRTGSLFGLATSSRKLGLYAVQGPIPVLKNVFIPPDSDGNLSMELEDVIPLFSVLASLCGLPETYKFTIIHYI